jgi:hypothetical protein
MKRARANLMTWEIFARWPDHFCRVAGLAVDHCSGEAEKYAGFTGFCSGEGNFSTWHDRC